MFRIYFCVQNIFIFCSEYIFVLFRIYFYLAQESNPYCFAQESTIFLCTRIHILCILSAEAGLTNDMELKPISILLTDVL